MKRIRVNPWPKMHGLKALQTHKCASCGAPLVVGVTLNAKAIELDLRARVYAFIGNAKPFEIVPTQNAAVDHKDVCGRKR